MDNWQDKRITRLEREVEELKSRLSDAFLKSTQAEIELKILESEKSNDKWLQRKVVAQRNRINQLEKFIDERLA